MKLENLNKYFLSDVEIFGSKDLEIKSLKAMHVAGKNDITYIKASRVERIEDLFNHPASTIITDYFIADGMYIGSQIKKCIITTSNPRLQMAKISHLFDYQKIGTKTLVSTNDYLIHPTAHVEESVIIGKGTEIGPNATIYGGIVLGKNVRIAAGASIGADGFGYEKDENNQWFKIAHLGKVIVGDNVEIGANTCIDRGTLGDTIIEDGCKIDNLVHIAHNVHLKKNSVVIAQAMIAGSVTIGENTWIAPCSAIREGRTIGNNALVGLGSVVVKNVEDNQTVMGVPAKAKK